MTFDKWKLFISGHILYVDTSEIQRYAVSSFFYNSRWFVIKSAFSKPVSSNMKRKNPLTDDNSNFALSVDRVFSLCSLEDRIVGFHICRLVDILFAVGPYLVNFLPFWLIIDPIQGQCSPMKIIH